MPKDYYDVLSVSQSASQDEIKKAYRKLAIKYHPDRNQGDKSKEEKFKAASEAYGVLGNTEKRAQYDRFGHGAFKGQAHGFQDVGDIFSAFRDIFEQPDFFSDGFGGGFTGGFSSFFSNSSRKQRFRRGEDLRYHLELDLKDVLTGAKKDIAFHGNVFCSICNGTGAKPGTSRKSCSRCGGKGQVFSRNGFVSFATTCRDCHGEGSYYEIPCAECNGQGKFKKKRVLTINIPPGVDTGAQLRMKGEGEPGSTRDQPGDLYVEVHLKPHSKFEKRGQNLKMPLPLSYLQALLGTKKKIKTLDDSETVSVPAGTQPGDEIRLPSLGLPSLKNPRRGDLICEIQVTIPKKLKKKEEEHLREIAELKKEDVLEKKGFFK